MAEETKNVMETALGIARFAGKGDACVVSHPDAGGACFRPVARMVWELAFCEVHGREAEAAALAELAEDTEVALGGLEDAEKVRLMPNPVLAHILQDVQVPTAGTRYESARGQDDALRVAYPLLSGHADPTITTFDYEAEYVGDGPVEWWTDARLLLCRFMREATGRGLPALVRELEPLRERASAQLVQAEDDYERRWVAPRRAARGAAPA